MQKKGLFRKLRDLFFGDDVDDVRTIATGIERRQVPGPPRKVPGFLDHGLVYFLVGRIGFDI